MILKTFYNINLNLIKYIKIKLNSNMNNNENQTDNVNEGYLKEMETNNFLFNEKIKKLNNLLVNANNNTYEKKIDNKKVRRQNFDNPNINIVINEQNNSESENYLDNKENKKFVEEIMQNSYNDRDSESDFNKNKNFFKNKDLNYDLKRENFSDKKIQNKSFENIYKKNKKEEEPIRNFNHDNINNNKILEYEKEIRQLKNENEYNLYVIDDLKNQISQNNQKEEKSVHNIINNDDYNNLLKEMDNKDILIDKLKEDIKNMKCKIENLLIENKKLKSENESLINQKEEMKAEANANKTEINNNLEKLNKLDLVNKKLNKDYLNLSNDYKKIKEEKEKLKSIIDEQNAAIFNYEKQLSAKPIMKKYEKIGDYDNNKINSQTKFEKNYGLNNNNNDDYKYEYIKEKRNNYKDYSYNENDFNNDEEDKDDYRNYKKANDNNENEYNYKLPINNTTRYKNKVYLNEMNNEKLDYNYNNNNSNINNAYNKTYKYNMKKSNSKSFEVYNEKNKKLKKGELNYLENYLNGMLKERSKLEKMLNDIPEHPRTLKDIKLRNTIKDKIEHNENEILITQQQLKNLRES